MTTNYKTSFLLPHDYEIPTFNYPQYVLPPVPYNYQPYTQDIWSANVIQPLKTKITAPAQCKFDENKYLNLFSGEFNECYYDFEIDLKEIDPTIQSISKFQDAYKTIEISNLNNLQIKCATPYIENFINDRNVNLTYGNDNCEFDDGLLSNITLKKEGISQTDDINFENTITLYTNNIKVNDIETKYAIAYTNGLPSGDYSNDYITKTKSNVDFLLQVTKLSNNDNDKIKETYLQVYYTNDVKLKIRFSKVLVAKLIRMFGYLYWGNDKNIVIDINNSDTLGIKNNSDDPVKIKIKPR
ncbi:hypothetical protein [Spiroplasma endosymbiont of Glossina fuscipes fuscipes]|uniref:hypothetical protein n=1 Tax=Spiroplasma endosymbiont of Glossina fuscipes fuscipes TaxID=2004463 RepID=UPI003C77D628